MKVTPKEVAALAAAIKPLNTLDRRVRYKMGDFPRSAAVKDLDKRYRWDLFWEVRGMDIITSTDMDSHIDTALRKVVPPLL